MRIKPLVPFLPDGRLVSICRPRPPSGCQVAMKPEDTKIGSLHNNSHQSMGSAGAKVPASPSKGSIADVQRTESPWSGRVPRLTWIVLLTTNCAGHHSPFAQPVLPRSANCRKPAVLLPFHFQPCPFGAPEFLANSTRGERTTLRSPPHNHANLGFPLAWVLVRLHM